MKYIIGYIGKFNDLFDKWENNLSNFFCSPKFKKKLNYSTNCRIIEFDDKPVVENNFMIDGYAIFDSQIIYNKTKNLDIEKLNKDLYNKKRLLQSRGNYLLIFNEHNNIYFTNDYYGNYPLYFYRTDSKHIFFANDMKLFFYLRKDISFCESSIKEFLNPYRITEQNILSKSKTFFKNIYKLPNACTLKIDINNCKYNYSNYLNFKLLSKIKYIKPISSDPIKEISNKFEELLNRNIEEKIKYLSNEYLCSLSGGVDSAILSAAFSANSHSLTNVNFAIETENIKCNDSLIASSISKQLGQNIFLITNNGNIGLNNLDKKDYLTSLDSINFYNNNGYHQSLQNIAKIKNIRFNINGDGGDYLFCGISYSTDYYLRHWNFKKAFYTCKKYLERKKIKNSFKNRLKFMFGPFIPFYKNKLYYEMFWRDDSNFDRELYKDKNALKAYNKKLRKNFNKSRIFKDYSRRYIIDFMFPKGDYYDSNFENMKIVRPLMDIEFLEFALSIPNIYQNKNCFGNKEFENTKLILKNAYYDKLKNTLKNIKIKTNYGSLIAEVYRNGNEKIKQLMTGNLQIEKINFINIKQFTKKLNVLLNQVYDRQYFPNFNALLLTKIFNMELFLQLFEDKIAFYNAIKEHSYFGNQNKTIEVKYETK